MPEPHVYVVPEISCDHCKSAIEERVAPVEGVQSVVVDVDAKQVTVTGGDAVDVEAAITAAGYAVA